MMHKDRVWCVAPVETAEELAHKLTQYSWCCCCGFELGDYLWLNDATGEDSAQEYACIRKPTAGDPHYRQIESITCSWTDEQQMLAHIHSIHDDKPPPPIDSGPVVVARSGSELAAALGGKQSTGKIVHPTIETPEQHGRCPLCA